MYRLGIDLGGTNIVAGVVDKKYKIVAKASCKTAVPRPESEICDSMAEVAKKAVEKAKLTMDDIESVGIGVPGAVNPKTGIIEYSANLFFHNWEVVQMMEERLGKKVHIENDANAAALGEYLAGSAKGARNAVAITLGTGVGGGIIIDGKIYSGSNFAGAELGHMVIVKDGKECACGRRGCWETYASATGLINLTKQKILSEKLEFSYMLKLCDGDINKVNGRTAFDAMRDGDPTAKSVVEEYISYLSCGLVNIINIFQPDVLCIGGGISNEGENLLGPVRSYIERERYTKHNDKQTVICKCTLGNDAGIIGAAYLD
ncbi:ROK family protein [Ruminococcus sp.]|uniref:ROK family protein n=1 Tax=Ruminococcus sp. TaxID=41978 RepID=UPI0026099014|nr:ROK family protein [Ruminococcus sp.]MDD6988063.1 ROK family protein [Ruminococcus sp.]MDY6202066.1 ROK family protein [Ruminococcus sp.]